MNMFDECLNLSRKIDNVYEKMYTLKVKATSPKNQIITDMPKGSGQGDMIERYLIELERLENKLKKLTQKRNTIWKQINEMFSDNKETVEMLKWRFFCAYSWKECEEIMKCKYPNSNWNINKCFRVYRNAVYKLHK